MTIELVRTLRNDLALVGGEEHGVRFAFTERTGGASLPPYESLNLGTHVGDDPAHVAVNRRRVLVALDADDLGDSLLVPNQVHGDAVELVDGRAACDLASVRDRIAAGCDAIVCTAPRVPVMLCFADCVPVVLTCPGGFAVIHSGWKGTYARIAAKAARTLMKATGAAPEQLSAYIGPHILGDEYEVSSELIGRFEAEFPSARRMHEGRLLDLSACIIAALGEAGVCAEHVVDPRLSTCKMNERFFSYRAEDGASGCGRHAAVAVMAGV